MQVRVPEFSDETVMLVKENGIIPSSSKDRLKGEVRRMLEEDGNDTTDSGFQTSDTS